MARKRIVILGGGSGGLQLAAALGAERDMDVVLVDQVGSHLWKPRLHEFAAGTVNSNLTEISFYVLATLRGFRFEEGKVASIDRNEREIVLAPIKNHDGSIATCERRVGYDLLVVALGGCVPDFGIEGVAENAIRLDTRKDALRFRERFVHLMLNVRASGQPARITIVGSGATGTELASHLRVSERAFVQISADYDDKTSGGTDLLHIRLLEAADELMPGASASLRRSIIARLEALDIDYETGAKITAIGPQDLTAGDGSKWKSDMTVWAAGLVGLPLLSEMADFQIDKKGRIVVDDHLRSSVDPAIYVLGDAASLTLADQSHPLPPTAQCAAQQAAYLANALKKTVAGNEAARFDYKDHGRLISLGRAGSVGNLNIGSLRDLFVQGEFAEAAYRSLQRQHQWRVLGYSRGSVAILADMMLPTGGMSLKLHGGNG